MPKISIGFMAAILATVLWSLKPIYVSALKDTLSPGEIFFCAGIISILASCIGAVLVRRDLAKLFRAGHLRTTLKHCFLAGVLLSVWYIAFYAALSGSASAQVTIISFTWPFFAIFAMRLFAPHLQRPLKKREYPFLAMAFLGAAITASGENSNPLLLLFALAAALGSGFYLPFLSLALERVSNIVGSRLKASFIVVSIANIMSFLVATPVLLLSGVSVIPTHTVAPGDWALLAAIGLFTYLAAELIWCWAICTTRSPTITALPYFSPVISIILLSVLAGASVPPGAIVGMGLILSANLALHFQIARKLLPARSAVSQNS